MNRAPSAQEPTALSTKPLTVPGCNAVLIDLAFIVPFALAIVVLIERNGHRQWHMWDLSMVVDAAWRLHLGQRPTIDFISPLPIGFHVLGALAIKTWGINWSAFVHAASVWSVLVLVWQFALLRRLGTSRLWALAIPLASIAVTLIAKSYLYHSIFTTPVAGILVTASVLIVRAPNDRLGLASVGVASFLLALGKQNTLPILPLAAFVLLSMRETRLRIALTFLAAGLLAWTVIWFVVGDLAAVVRATIQAGTMRAGPNATALWGIRDGVPRAFPCDVTAVVFSIVPMFLWLGRTEEALRSWRERTLLASAVLVAVYGITTNNDFKMSDVPLMVLAAGAPWALVQGRSKGTAIRQKAALGFVLATTVAGIYAGVSRLTLSGTAGRVFSNDRLASMSNTGFFAGLQAGPRFKAIEEDLISVVAKAGVAKDEVFFGPALEFAYAAFGFTPPKGLPVWWHPGTSYSPRDNATIAARFRSNLPKLVVFLLDDAPNLPPAIRVTLYNEYAAQQVGNLKLLRLLAPCPRGQRGGAHSSGPLPL